MTVVRIDPVSGNNANDGSTWALAKRDLPGTLTGGNEYRFKQSPMPVKVNSSGTFDWTKQGRVVDYSGTTVPGTVNLVSCDGTTGWTNGTNGTVGNDTTYYKLGTEVGKANNRATSLTVAAGASTTELLAYYDLGATGIDVSSCERISFWMRTSAATAATHFVIKLCSDQAGANALETFTIPALPVINTLYCLTLDKGSALTSTAVKSVAIYSGSVDPGTPLITIDNIIACSATGITLASLISPSNVAQGAVDEDEVWYPVKAIWGDKIIIDNGAQSPGGGASAGSGYSGASISGGDCYHRECFRPTLGDTSELNMPGYSLPATATTAIFTVPSSGSSGSLVTINGGWNGSDVAEAQDGETWVSALSQSGYSWYAVTRSFISLDYLCAARVSVGLLVSLYSSSIGYYASSGCGTSFSQSGSSIYHGSQCNYTTLVSVNPTTAGMAFISLSDVYAKNIYSYGCLTGPATGCNLQLTNGMENVYGRDRSYNEGVVKLRNGHTHLQGMGGDSSKIYNLDTADHTSTSIYSYYSSNIQLFSPLTWSGDMNSNLPAFGRPNRYRITKYNGDATDNRYLVPVGEAVSQASVVYGTNPLAWKITPRSTANFTSTYPFVLPIAKAAVNASALVTVKAQMRRSNTGLTLSLAVRGGQLAGVSEGSTAMTAIADTWEEVTLTFTPSEAGVIEIEAWAYGGTTYAGYVGNITITQA